MKGIRELAQHLGISIGTVSRALNNKPDVNESTRKRVIEAAIEFGYVPNQSGRSLRQGSTNTIGFTLQTGSGNDLFEDSFPVTAAVGMQNVFKKHNLDLVLLPYSIEDDPDEYLKRLVMRGFVDGLIISQTLKQDRRIETLQRSGLPFVALGRNQTSDNFAWVDMDFEGMAYDAILRLANAGHRRIAVTNPPLAVNYIDLFQKGCQRAAAEIGPGLDLVPIPCTDLSEASGAEAARYLLSQSDRPTAILLNQNSMAIGFYHVLERTELRVGRDIAVIGMLGSGQTRFLQPSLSHYSLSVQSLGEIVAETLLNEIQRLSTEPTRDPMTNLFPTTWQEGESSKSLPLMP